MENQTLTALAAAIALSTLTAAPLSAGIQGNGGAQVPSVKEAPCTIESLVSKAQAQAREEAGKFAAQKNEELTDQEHRADRASRRVKNGDNFSWEGGSKRQEGEYYLPRITVRSTTKSFHFIDVSMKETRTPFGHFEACWWTIDLPFGKKLKTKATCWRNSDIVWSVPQFRTTLVKFDLPASVEVVWEKHRFSFDTPTVTIRDNEQELKNAPKEIARIQDDLEKGSNAITAKHESMLRKEIADTLTKAEKDALAQLDRSENEALSPILKQRSELSESLARARTALASAGKSAEADQAFGPAMKIIDEAIAKVKSDFTTARAQVSREIADLKDAYLGNGASSPACPA